LSGSDARRILAFLGQRTRQHDHNVRRSSGRERSGEIAEVRVDDRQACRRARSQRGHGILHPLQRRDGVERDDVRASAATANGAAFRGITIALD